MAQEEKIIKGYNSNCYSHDVPHVSSSNNPNITFGTNPLEFFNYESHNSVSHNSDLFWKTPCDHPSSSSSKPIITDSIGAGDFYQFDHESSLQKSMLIPCEPNERPSQGLSLSLSSTNPSTIGIQAFELVRPPQNHQNQGYFMKSMSFHEHQSQYMGTNQDGYLRKPPNFGGGGGSGGDDQEEYNIRSSRYLMSTQDLLNEFCNLGTKQMDNISPKPKAQRASYQVHDDDLNNANSLKIKSLTSLEFLELQKRKSKLLQMLEEVDRRYKHYCDQMKAVVSSFEEVAGNGAAKVYSVLASKAMSRHFKCLKDGIVGEIKTTKKAMGEKDSFIPGMTKGETPRLKLLDQSLRQQRAFQQMTMMDSQPWRPQRGLPERSVSVLRAWLFEHFLHPYPSDVDKHILARQTGLSRSQVSNWFINARVRLWKPMVEEMYMEETKENEKENTEDAAAALDRGFNPLADHHRNDPNPQTDQKPTSDQLMRIDSECLSSIINHPAEKMDHHHQLQGFTRAATSDSFGAMDVDFSTSYHTHHHHSFNFAVPTVGGSGGGGGGGVSLTLGLQQHSNGGHGGGVSAVTAAFSPPPSAQSNSLFYPRDHMEDCQPGLQFSTLLEGDQGQNLPYRNLIGAQLLNDLAG